MDIRLKLFLALLAAALLPAALLAACLGPAGFSPAAAALAAAAAALAAAGAGAALLHSGLARPMTTVSAAIKKFIADGYRLDSALPRAGWPEGGALISAANRLMLELGAFRAFQINQVVEERGKAQALIETIPDGALLVDDRGGIIYSNRTALKLLGIEKLTPEVRLPGSVSVPAFAEPLSGMLASPEQHLQASVELPRPSGPARTYLLIAAQFPLASLKKPGRVVILRDVTQEMELEKTKESFFQMITHDMRAPLSSILGYTQSLNKLIPKSPVSDKHIDTIIRAASRLNGMITDILNTTKMERGSMKLEPLPVDAGELLSRVREAHLPEAERRKIALEAGYGKGPVFLGDAALMERVVTNLVGNALKFTPQGGSVRLSCEAAGRGLRIQVADTGPGIPRDKLEMVFEKYAQMEEHSSMGFGLGLAMCRLAVELHKGRIWVESEVGKGSRFIIELPAEAA